VTSNFSFLIDQIISWFIRIIAEENRRLRKYMRLRSKFERGNIRRALTVVLGDLARASRVRIGR